MFRKILVPIDFSEEAVNAIDTAIDFVEEDGTIVVMHAFPEDLSFYASFFDNPSELEARIMELSDKAEQKLNDIVNSYKQSSIKIEAFFTQGKPYLEILKKEAEVDLTILGMRKKLHGLSVSPLKVIRKAQHTILIQKGTEKLNLKSILIPLDLSENIEKLRQYVSDLKHVFNLKLYALNVVEILPFETGESAIQLNLSDIDIETVKQNVLKTMMENFAIEGTSYNVALGVDPASEIVDFAEDADISLITMPGKGKTAFERAFLGSVTEKLVHISPKPILIVK